MGSIVRLICTSPDSTDGLAKEQCFDIPLVEMPNIKRRMESRGWSVKVVELK
jgi:hypothetical protein